MESSNAEAETKPVYFAVRRLDLGEDEPSSVVSIDIQVDSKVPDVIERVKDKLGIDNSELIIRVRNLKGVLVPMNGRITQLPNTQSRPLQLEIVVRFQSVQPNPRTVEMTKFNEPVTRKMEDILERITLLEDNVENFKENKTEKAHQEVTKLENTVTFLQKRINDAESVAWNGMFVKNPLW